MVEACWQGRDVGRVVITFHVHSVGCILTCAAACGSGNGVWLQPLQCERLQCAVVALLL
jgi:hypothetical protein